MERDFNLLYLAPALAHSFSITLILIQRTINPVSYSYYAYLHQYLHASTTGIVLQRLQER